jgi:hypothetical protein
MGWPAVSRSFITQPFSYQFCATKEGSRSEIPVTSVDVSVSGKLQWKYILILPIDSLRYLFYFIHTNVNDKSYKRGLKARVL